MMMIDDVDDSSSGIGTIIDVSERRRGWIGNGDSPVTLDADAVANDDHYKSLTSEEERKDYYWNVLYKKNLLVSDYPDPRFFTDPQFRLDNPNYKSKLVTLYEREQKWEKSGRIPIKFTPQNQARLKREMMRQDEKLRKRQERQEKEREKEGKEKEREIVRDLKKLKLEEQQEKDQSQLENQTE